MRNLLEKDKLVNLFGTTFVRSSIFYNIENSTEIISGPSVHVYDSVFIKCNSISHAFSILSTDILYMTNIIFDSSGGAKTRYNQQEPSSVVKIKYIMSVESRSDYCIIFNHAKTEIDNINFSNNHCPGIYFTAYGPKHLNSRFISLISNECMICAKLEADFNCINKNAYFQFVRNKCSKSLLESQRADCYCDWFYFIDNNVTNCNHVDAVYFFFTNSFSTSEMTVLLGTTNGIVNIDTSLTELPFPSAMRQRPRTRSIRTKSTITLSLNLFLFYF